MRPWQRAAVRLTTALDVIGMLLFIAASLAWLVLAGTVVTCVERPTGRGAGGRLRPEVHLAGRGVRTVAGRSGRGALPWSWGLTEAWLRVLASVGATISAHSVRNYRTGVRVFLAAWAGVDFLHPDPAADTTYLRQLAPGFVSGCFACRHST
jgi:hypothetical protein